MLPESILKLFKEVAGKYMTFFINRCQLEQKEWFQKRNEAISILTNIVVQPSMLIAYVDVYKNNNEIVIFLCRSVLLYHRRREFR